MNKCRMFLFNIIFLIFFCIGCLGGIMLFRCISDSNPDWVCTYGSELFSGFPNCLMGVVISACRPILVLLLLSMVAWGYRLVPVCIVARGIFSSYFACVCYASGVSLIQCLVHGILILPGYYFLCRWIYFGTSVHCSAYYRSTV